MNVYEHISNITKERSNRIKEATNQNGWEHRPMDKNQMSRYNKATSRSMEISKESEEGYLDIFLDDHLIIYRKHGKHKDDNRYNRMNQWENEIRIREHQDEPIDQIIAKIDEVSNEEKDRVYLGNKLLRETQDKSRREEINQYLDTMI